MLRFALVLSALLIASLACNFPGFAPPATATLPPPGTPTATFAPIGGGDGPTATAVIVQPSSTPTAVLTGTPTETPTLPPTPTQKPLPRPTATSAGPLVITNVLLAGVERDATRPNGAIAKIKIEFSGGKPPYTFYDDNVLQAGNPLSALTACGGTLVHTARVDSADGQTASRQYYFSPINCP